MRLSQAHLAHKPLLQRVLQPLEQAAPGLDVAFKGLPKGAGCHGLELDQVVVQQHLQAAAARSSDIDMQGAGHE